MTPTILTLHLDPTAHAQVESACLTLPATCLTTDTIEEALLIAAQDPPQLLLCPFPEFEAIHEQHPDLPIVLVADGQNSDQMIEAMKRGALDFLVTPTDMDQLTTRLDAALRVGKQINPWEEPHRLVHTEPHLRMVGQSPAMQEVYRRIGLIAPRNVNVLVTGESGTGKELVAKAIHEHSNRAQKPFLAVNCAAIAESLLESELFGHEKGAFTGADQQRPGKFEQADGGTLFLDEVGDMPLSTQAKLLRVLQEGAFQRVGGTEQVRCDVRVISATNQPLEKLIATRAFRPDLYYRLKVTTIHLPPLREREVDAVLLAHHFVATLNEKMGTQIRQFAPEAVTAILAYPWPGNIRELENVIKASLVQARGRLFLKQFLPPHIQNPAPGTFLETSASVSNTTPGISTPLGEPAPPSGNVGSYAKGDDQTSGDGPISGGGRTISISPNTPPDIYINPELTTAADHPPNPMLHFFESAARNPNLHGRLYQHTLATIEKLLLTATLEQTRGNLTQAAKALGISRTTLRQKLKKHHLTLKTTLTTPPA